MKRQNRFSAKLVIGLTGNFGSGKTTVASLLRSYGAEVIDADKISHQVIAFGTGAYKRIVRIFGRAILRKDGRIDRAKLGEIVFNNKRLLGALNRIIHPQVIRIIRKKIKKSSRKIIILDAPLLIEAGLRRLPDKLIVVKINRKQQLQRLAKKTKLKKPQILQRIRAQVPLSAKVRLADFVIDNSATLKETEKQVKAIRRLLWKS